ncbi:MAG: hypothetical protein K2X27_27945 [Candidatus Obscuribacterales bacterium]|nr:hypothetical protein [Candidatus Obscuribacterales bacterium]
MSGSERFDLDKTLKQLKEKLGPSTAVPSPDWAAWDKKPTADKTAPQVQAAPEQVQGTGRADEATKQSVYKAVNDASKQANRNQASGLYMQAIESSNRSKDPSLQAISKVEYGLANLSWGYGEQGFKWILEAGSNNPSLYDMNKNQDFLQRLSRAGISEKAVRLLLKNGQENPLWYKRRDSRQAT